MADKTMARSRGTALDRMEDASRHFCDQLLHVVMRFDVTLDESRLRRAARLMHEVEPVLACRWVSGKRPYWQRKAGAYSHASFMLVPCDDPMAEAMQFMNVRADPGADPLVQCHIYRGKFDVIVLKVGHVACDAHGARHLAYLLAELYNDTGERDWPTGDRVTERGMGPIWRVFPFQQRLRYIMRALRGMDEKPSQLGTAWSIPFTSREMQDPRMMVRRFDGKRSEEFVSFARQRSATVNDVFLTAFVRSAHKVFGPKPGVPVPFKIAFDLRQCAPGLGADVANLTSTILLSQAMDLEHSFEEDLHLIKAEMDRARSGQRAAMSMPLLKLTYGILPHTKVKARSESVFETAVKQRNVGPMFADLGTLEGDRLAFGGSRPGIAFITSPTAYPPLVIMGLSCYDGAFTLTSGFCEYGIDVSMMERLMDEMDRELPR